MSELDILIQLKEQLIFFFDELIELLPTEPDLIIIRIFIKDKFPIADIMNYMITKLVPLKHLVVNKDEGFFINNNILFEEVDSKKVNHFKKLVRSGKLDEDDKEVIWKWFRGFIYLAEKYISIKSEQN